MCSDLAGLRFHKNTHSGENPFKCVWPGCSQSFPNAGAKEDHLQKEHIKDAILECEYPGCGSKFSTFSDREMHRYDQTITKISDPMRFVILQLISYCKKISTQSQICLKR